MAPQQYLSDCDSSNRQQRGTNSHLGAAVTDRQIQNVSITDLHFGLGSSNRAVSPTELQRAAEDSSFLGCSSLSSVPKLATRLAMATSAVRLSALLTVLDTPCMAGEAVCLALPETGSSSTGAPQKVVGTCLPSARCQVRCSCGMQSAPVTISPVKRPARQQRAIHLLQQCQCH
jgi:hypothetical protein